jgi:HlyD family secretion protein
MLKFSLHSLSILIFLSCKEKPEKTQPILQTITESVYASGIVKSKNQYKVYSMYNGLIDRLLVKEGALIKKGDPIIRLINNVGQINQENAQIAADYASVASNAEKLDELKLSTEIAKTKMENDDLFLQKQENLWEAQIGTQNELILKKLNLKNSKNAYLSAKLKYTSLQKLIKFQSQQAKNNLELQQKVNSEYTIKSDVDGKVYQLPIGEGEMVNITVPVAIIGDDLSFFVELQVDEYDITRVKLGQKIALSMDSYKGQVYNCVVSKIDPIMNEKTKSFTIEANFLKPPKTLYPFLTCEANIIILQKTNTITIPRSYLLEGDSVIFEKGRKVKVKTGLKDFQKVEILAGLTSNDYIFLPKK